MTLRQLSDSDKEEIWALRSNVHINKYLERQPSKSLEEAITFINRVNSNISNNDSLYWAITLTGHKNLIGTICLFDFSDEKSKCEMGYELLIDYQGQGIMHEAAEKVIEYGIQTICLTRIEAFTHKDNQSSTNLLNKLGFKISDKPDQANNDLLLFSLTR
ncbi:GNAT family N-acetyltransferase [Adhaeribacter radiodurans]|uniref:GNAT family N-acetyltransferase n=1 Tax=Adhaeribacter radiodurans TaxID=2745197 RepID=A0A7L7L5L1_9BACT|nr:GNAT family N-acetyltransferase [Adhaeribacter radiodurans]QMU28102.1 GNAT family N-acetyltransferase [Adhaeribacter radiodurans]